MKKVEIPLSKSKISILLIGAMAFVTFGILFIILPDTFVSNFRRNPQIIRLTGIAAVLFFGGAAIYGIRKLFDKRIGLIVDENGITDNTNASSIGLIKWADIIEIKTEQVKSTKFILIYTTNPERYLDKAKGLNRKIIEGNNRLYGTPLSIISNTLKCNFSDLKKLINDSLNEQRKNA